MKQMWQRTALALAFSAAAGLAYAQQPGTGTNMQDRTKEKDSGDIVDRQTQPPGTAGSATGSSESRSGQGAGASQRSSGEFIDRQTKPSQGTGTSSGEPTSRTTDTTSGRIVDEQTKPGTGRMDPAQGGGTTR